MILDKLIGLFSSDMGIDLGTANTIVSLRGKGIIINEPSVVAVRTSKYGKQTVLAVGLEAKNMVGKTPGDIEAIRPMRDGVIADFNVTELMIRHFIQKAHQRKSFIRPRIVICIPYGLTQVERKAVREAAMSAGARAVSLIDEPMAAAIGAGLPIQEPKGNLVVDIGGGTTEIGVISLGGLVASNSIRVAGDSIDRAIIEYVKDKHSLLIGDRSGEEIKISIGTAIKRKETKTMVIKGKDQLTGLLKRLEITSEEVLEAMSDPLKQIANALKAILEDIPADLASDIVENGVVLTGGGALIHGLDKYLSDIIKLPVYVSEEPLLAVAKGTAKSLELQHTFSNEDF